MQLIFDNLSELERMIHAMGYVHRGAQVTLTAGEVSITGSAQDVDAICREAVTVAACEQHVAELLPIPGDEQDAQDIAELKADHPTEPTKRKRRTKAEIEAEKAAQVDQNTVAHPAHSEPRTNAQANPLDNLKSEADAAMSNMAANVGALTEIKAMAGLYDGADTLTHISEGRDFIAKHGFPAYNETMTLADVPANITTHTPEQASLHRAAMAWKAAQLAKG